MAFSDWSSRLVTVGASTVEVTSISASYQQTASNVQAALDTLVESLSNAQLLVMLNNWRANPGPFQNGYPGGGLLFGTGVAVLTGQTADDVYPIAAGTGKRMLSLPSSGPLGSVVSVSSGSSNVLPVLLAPPPTGSASIDTAALNALIDAANSANALIMLGQGTAAIPNYQCTGTLHTIGVTTGGNAGNGCRGIIGSGGGAGTNNQTGIVFNADGTDHGDCIVSWGLSKRFADLFLDNQAVTSTGTTLRIVNCAYGDFSNVYARADGASSTAIMLEQQYTGTAFDAWLLYHVGCWYNTFRNVTAIYGKNGTTGGNVGDGLSFTVNANARAVVNPVGQPAGTYTGSVNYNAVSVFDIEGKSNGLHLQYANHNELLGNFIGCTNQVTGTQSSGNLFKKLVHNQWNNNVAGGFAYNLDGTCDANTIFHPTGQYGGSAAPWPLGNVGTNANIYANPEIWTPSSWYWNSGGATLSTTEALRTQDGAAGMVQIGGGGATATIYFGSAQDVNLNRSGVGQLASSGQLKGADGLTTKTGNTTGLTSAQIDALFAHAPPDGTVLVDTTNNIYLQRSGGKWYKSAALTLIN